MLRALPALLLVAAFVAACGTSKSAPPAAGSPGVPIAVTADWGTAAIADGAGTPGSVVSATRGVTKIATTYGGRYVSSIGGKAGDGTRDWIFWINGIEASVGAADVKVSAQDSVWWDLHRWPGRVHVPAVIASWPMPLTRGITGQSSPVTADAPLSTALRKAGANVTLPAATSGPRALVGGGAVLLKRDPTWRAAVANPTAAGLTAWIDHKGHVRVWDAQAQKARLVPTAVAVIVATTDGFGAGDPPVVVVAGITPETATAAAQYLVQHPEVTHHTTALCLGRDNQIDCVGGVGLVQ
ncbi:MAG: DUF4430 domain-containing protein [Thermoleophilia bacterium]